MKWIYQLVSLSATAGFIRWASEDSGNMASMLRTGLAALNPSSVFVGLCKTTPRRHNVAVTQVAWITSRDHRRDRPPKPKPFDWKRKPSPILTFLFDPIFDRFDENTRVVVVDGMPGVGKDKFAKEIAQELDMHYMKPPSFDDLWINPYGFDERSLNDKLPIDAQRFDVTTFLNDPNHRNVAAMQMGFLWLRSSQYIDALAHLMSTGDGVVVQRSPWSDRVFMRAMAQCGYVSRAVHEHYFDLFTAISQELLRPHLHIYLDAPISAIKEKIKQRNVPYEVNSKALTDKYLNALEKSYKNHLREMSEYGNMLIYDWTNEGDVSIVVEDIERLEFDIDPDKKGIKFYEWKFHPEWDIKNYRKRYCFDKLKLLLRMNIFRTDVPELYMSGSDDETLEKVLSEIPSKQYAPGYNPGIDKGILFRSMDYLGDLFPKDKLKTAK